MIEPEPLHVLGVHGLTGQSLDPLPHGVARRMARRVLLRGKPLRYGFGPGDLRAAGWGVVFPEGVDAAVRQALGPLLALRQRQAGDRYRELLYRPGEGAADFRTRLRSGLGRVDPRQMPWYLLLVGDPVDLPYGYELDLDVPHAVGRLAFDDLADLAAYASRVAEAERRGGRRRPSAAVFAPTHPGDRATARCAAHLARPMAELLEARTACVAAIGSTATRRALLERLAGGLDLLLAAGHATVFPADYGGQRRRQGALVCADWPGRSRCPDGIAAGHTVAGDDLPAAALDRGVAILFGCHTAGTPRYDVFDSPRAEDARELTPRPFVAAWPRRLLGREGGALAVLGHVGRAFEASFRWRGVPQTGPLEDFLLATLDGRRLGEAMEGFSQRFADLATTWASSQTEAGAARDPLDLWLAFHDARSWSLIGDPAVRLPAAAGPGER